MALSGCASPKGKFLTQRDATYQTKLGKVLLVYYNQVAASILGRDFSDRFARRASALLSQKNVASETVSLQQTALDRNAPLRAAAARFRPSQLLWLGVTRVNTSSGMHRTLPGELPQFNSETSVSLEFNLVDAQSGRTVWRGEAHFSFPPRAEDVAQQLVDQLAAAQFF